MNEEQAPWWSWAPRFPKPAIACAAAIYDTIAVGTILLNLNDAEALKLWPTLKEILDAARTQSIVSNALTVSIGIQLNAELPKMILTLKANYEEKKEARAAGRAEGNAEAEAKFRAWYEANKDRMQDAPPPPFSGNGNANGAGPY